MTHSLEYIDQAQEVFDVLMEFGTTLEADIPQEVLEAIDYVANFCGDIAKNRDYTPEKLEDAFPTLLRLANEQKNGENK